MQFTEDVDTYHFALPALNQHQYCPIVLLHTGSVRWFPSLDHPGHLDVPALQAYSRSKKEQLVLVDPRGLTTPESFGEYNEQGYPDSTSILWDECPGSAVIQRFFSHMESLGLHVALTHKLGEKHKTMRSWYVSLHGA